MSNQTASKQTGSKLVGMAAAALLSACLGLQPVEAHDVASEMVVAASRLLRSLDAQQQQAVAIPLDSDRRTAWHFIPSSMMDSHGGRRGLAVKTMAPHQRVLALGLLNTALSHHGQLQAATVMALEAILRDLENGNAMRDPEMYHVAIHGLPSSSKTWGWSFEGHHLSVNLTLVGGQNFSVTPSFFGSNPAIVPEGPFQGLETLAAEQQLARKLVTSLSQDQLSSALIATDAPADVITGADRKVDRSSFDPPQGIGFDELNESQQKALLHLVNQFAHKYRQAIVDQVNERKPISDGKGMVFAWAGSLKPGEGHYYRIQTPKYLFEYDNTQNGANHVHAVWRDFDGDFGEDLLRHHLETSPHHQK